MEIIDTTSTIPRKAPRHDTAADRLLKFHPLSYPTFDDVLLVPQYSDIHSRKSIDISTKVTKLRTINIPIIAANMDSVCEENMMSIFNDYGSIGVLHRYMSNERQLNIVKKLRNPLFKKYLIAVAVGIKNGILEHIYDLTAEGATIIVIDVAHGHHKQVADLIVKIKSKELLAMDNKPLEVIAGNIATEAGARFLIEHGVDGIKIGVGPGSICTTRIVTGHGFPQLSAIAQIAKTARNSEVPIIADGGIRNSGDIVKALAAGANSVMIGSLLAGTDQAPGEIFTGNDGRRYKLYRGMASREAQRDFYGNDPQAPEGVTTSIEYKGPVRPILDNLKAGIRSGLSYSGVRNIKELQIKADWAPMSHSGLIESKSVKPYRGR